LLGGKKKVEESQELISMVSERDVKDFEENIVWRAFLQVMKDRIEIVRAELEVGTIVGKSETGAAVTIPLKLEDITRRQGECAGMRFMTRLPEIVKDLKAEDLEKIKRKEGGKDVK
jgi:hypothetical protein